MRDPKATFTSFVDPTSEFALGYSNSDSDSCKLYKKSLINFFGNRMALYDIDTKKTHRFTFNETVRIGANAAWCINKDMVQSSIVVTGGSVNGTTRTDCWEIWLNDLAVTQAQPLLEPR
jgi:hypothetical protein